MTMFKVGGHLADPDDPRYWGFDTLAGVLGAEEGSSPDLRPYSSEVHNQRGTSSCVANSVAKALEIKERRAQALEGKPLAHTDISRMHLYYLSRTLHHQQHDDGGTYISLCCEALKRFGIVPEKNWPFVVSKVNTAPNWGAMRKAYKRKMINGYYRIKSTGTERVEDCIKALRAGHPVVYGTTVDRKQWFQYKAGMVINPVSDVEGRHATVLVGWDDSRSLFIGENSWGSSWGEGGCYLMSPDVIEHKDSRDFWVIRGHWEDAPTP